MKLEDYWLNGKRHPQFPTYMRMPREVVCEPLDLVEVTAEGIRAKAIDSESDPANLRPIIPVAKVEGIARLALYMNL